MNQLQQRSTAWRLLRCGDVTASRFRDIKPPRTKSDGHELPCGELIGQTAFSYLEELLAELITGKPQDRFRSAATEHGDFYEAIHRDHAAAELYERFGQQLSLAEGDHAYLTHPTEPHIGCSPDYVVGDHAGGELKCPANAANHVAFLRRGLDWFMKENRDQVFGAMWLRDWEHYYVSSFHPDFPADLRLVLWEVDRNYTFKVAGKVTNGYEYIERLSQRVLGFRDLVLDEYHRLAGGPF